MGLSQQDIRLDVTRLCALSQEKHLQSRLDQLLLYVFFQDRESLFLATQDIWLAQNLSENCAQSKGVLSNAMEMGFALTAVAFAIQVFQDKHAIK